MSLNIKVYGQKDIKKMVKEELSLAYKEIDKLRREIILLNDRIQILEGGR